MSDITDSGYREDQSHIRVLQSLNDELRRQLKIERAAREQAEARLVNMRGTVVFFASVIKCRENWSDICDEAMECMKDTPPPILAELKRLRYKAGLADKLSPLENQLALTERECIRLTGLLRVSNTERNDAEFELASLKAESCTHVCREDAEYNAKRAEQAESKLKILRAEVEAHRGGKFDDSWALQCEENWRLEKECDTLKVEYESRVLWIAEMNRILGCDNPDGFHSEPSPHDLARQLVKERDSLRSKLQAANAVMDKGANIGWGNAVTVEIERQQNLREQSEALAEKDRIYLNRQLESITRARDEYAIALSKQSELHSKAAFDYDALKLKLEAAKVALEHITGCEDASDEYEGKIIYAILRAKTALSQLNGLDDGESQPPSTAKGTLKAFEQILNATPFPEGKEMIQTGKVQHD